VRIERIDIESFGALAGANIELDHPLGGLRFVVGPNEAGKSTLRAALRASLFGIVGNTVAGRAASSVHLTLHLRSGHGERASWQRRGKGAPRDAFGNAVDEATLAKWLAVDERTFERLYALGHDELRRYGGTLLQADDDLGRLVFGAALGGREAPAIAAALDARIKELFTPGTARKPHLNAALAAQREARREWKTLEERADAAEWSRLHDRSSRVAERLRALEATDVTLLAEWNRAKRVQRTANQRARWADLTRDHDRVRSEGPFPDAVAAARIEAAMAARTAALAAEEAIGETLRRLHGDRAMIPTERGAWNAAAEIAALVTEVGAAQEARALQDEHARGTPAAAPLPEAARLQAAVTDARDLRPKMQELPDWLERLAQARVTIGQAKAGLGLAGVSDAVASALPVPSERAIADANGRAVTLEERRQRVELQLAKVVEARTAAERELEALRSGRRALPTDAEITAARTQRDAAWRAVRGWFVAGAIPEPRRDEAAWAREVDAGIDATDRLVDVVRGDVARAAAEGGVAQRLAELRADGDRLTREVAECDAAAQAAEAAWRDAWAGVGIAVGTPTEMLPWRSAWERLRRQMDDVAGEAARVEERHTLIGVQAANLRAALDANGVAVPEGAGALALLNLAEEALAREARGRNHAERLAAARGRLQHLEARVAPLRALLPATDQQPIDRAIHALESLRARQERHAADAARLEREIATAERSLLETRARRAGHERALEEEAAALGIDAAEIETALRRQARVEALRAAISEERQRLREAGDGLEVETLLREAEEWPVEVVEARIASLSGDRQALLEQRDAAQAEKRDLQAQIAALDGGDASAALHERVAQGETRIEDLAEEVATLTLAQALLDRVMARSRRSDHGDLLERASDHFRTLTDGEFAGLEIESHEDRAFAVALRANGDRLYPPSLSDGTLDQLWLAWRLAGVEVHLDRTGPFPLLIDDVLVHFDDRRSGCAFQALARLAERTQVIVFTHHPHLLDVARARLGADRVKVSTIERAPLAAPLVQVVAAEQAAARAAVPLPEAPRVTTTARGGAEGVERDTERLRAVLDPTLRGKSELLDLSGIAEGSWAKAIGALLEGGIAEQEGTKRGAKYRLVRS
jgi:uncharacterized protein YhaN